MQVVNFMTKNLNLTSVGFFLFLMLIGLIGLWFNFLIEIAELIYIPSLMALVLHFTHSKTKFVENYYSLIPLLHIPFTLAQQNSNKNMLIHFIIPPLLTIIYGWVILFDKVLKK